MFYLIDPKAIARMYLHDHGEQEAFEDRVYEYLGDNFTVDGGCNVQRAFETSVRAVVADFVENASMHDDGLVRNVLRTILTKARELPAMTALPILALCSDSLSKAAIVPTPYVPYSNGATPERTNA